MSGPALMIEEGRVFGIAVDDYNQLVGVLYDEATNKIQCLDLDQV